MPELKKVIFVNSPKSQQAMAIDILGRCREKGRKGGCGRFERKKVDCKVVERKALTA